MALYSDKKWIDIFSTEHLPSNICGRFRSEWMNAMIHIYSKNEEEEVGLKRYGIFFDKYAGGLMESES